MRNPNGYGGIVKLKGKRRRPYMVRITEWQINDKGEKVQKYKPIGYYKLQRDAELALAAYNNNPSVVRYASITFSELYDIWSSRKFASDAIKTISDSTKKSYRLSYNMCESIKNMRLADIKKSHLEDIVRNNSDRAESLIKLKILLNQLYDFAIGEDMIDKNYAADLVLPKSEQKIKHVPFTEDEIKALFKSMDSHYLIDTILIMIYTGLSISELCDIVNANVHTDDRYMVTGPEGKNDYRENRIIPLHDKIIPLVQRRYSADREYLITNDTTGSQYAYQTYRDHWDALMPQLYKEKMHLPHDCRHTFATLSKKYKMDELCRVRIMGHSPKMLIDRVYTHTEIEELIREVNKLP